MKYIDFHVHAFNDKIAQRAIESLEITAGYKALSDGTLSDTRLKYEKYGIDRAVILPVATKPSQQTVINNWASEIQDSRFISFGSVHPDAEDVMEEIERIKSLGLHGIKIHPDYIGMYVNDERMIRVFKKCAEINLPVVIHCGYDPYSPDKSYASPEMVSEAFDKVPEMTLISAHLGGVCMWDDVEKYLVGKSGNFYLDTGILGIGFNGKKLEHEQFERIVKKHGAERILFASDFPWDNPLNEIEMINRLNITDDEKEMIFYRNAEKLLGI